MKKTTKRAQNKQKLQTFEWTDEAIEKCNAVGPDFYAKQAISESKDLEVINTMEAKIDRVQKRKKETEDRLERKKKMETLTAPKRDYLKEVFPVRTGNYDSRDYSMKLADNLNSYFYDFFSRLTSLPHELDIYFPLHLFSSSEYHERLHFLFKNIQYGACLLYQPSRGDESYSTPLGKWYNCRILSVEESSVIVEIDGLILQETYAVDRTQVCLANHDVHMYVRQILDCLQRRANCVGLMRYFSFVRSIPINSRITSTLTEDLAHRIHMKAGNTPRLLEIDPAIASNELQDAKEEYEFVMNKLLLDTSVLAVKNRSLLRSLQLQMPSVAPREKKDGYRKTTDGANYNMKKFVSTHRTGSYLCSLAAIKSLHSVLRENKNVEAYTIVKINYSKPFSLEKFDRFIVEQLVTAGRIIKQEWPVKTGAAVIASIIKGQENSIYPDCIQYDIGLRNVFELENSNNPIKNFLERMNFMMSDVLYAIVDRSVNDYVATVEDLCSCEIDVRDIRDIRVVVPENSLYKRKCLPPLYTVAFRVAAEDKCLNLEELEQNKKDIAAWMKTKEAEAGEKCPIKMLAPVMGKSFEYSTSPADFKESIVRAFRHIVSDFLDVPHVQKFVMEKIYFPAPRYVSSVSLESEMVKESQVRVEKAVEKAVAPLSKYLMFFKKYETFVNIDNAAYIASRIHVNRRDPDSTEMELPVTVNLNQVEALLEEHFAAMREIEDSLPITPIECGLFLVEVVSIRNLLLDKHRAIIGAILSDHCERCRTITDYLDDEFKKINKNLSKRPENIEQLTELEEYINSLGNILGALQNFIAEMMSYQNVLEKYKYKTDLDSGTQRWSVFGFPKKIASKCAEVQESNVAVKRRFKDEMMGEQANFLKTVHELEQQVVGLENLVDLSDVANIASVVKEVETRLNAAQAKVKLFNSREMLFEVDITDYEELNRIQRNFEPYSNLWQTAKEWLELSMQWKKGRFVDLNADDIEKNVDRFNVAINKAAKYFTKADMKHQSTIANKIKAQVAEFVPEVPMIVTLRNPGMRDRHWQKIAEQLQVDILPIENFTTEQIISMNLKDSLDLIQKIGESAAKEYQIEQALDKMEREWENMNLNIHNYRETGTGVLRGIDDINVVLDEQITMTQVWIDALTAMRCVCVRVVTLFAVFVLIDDHVLGVQRPLRSAYRRLES
jgi:dynein heavy chain